LTDDGVATYATRAMTTELRNAVGILHETKNRWERRVPLVPAEIATLVADGIEVRVERSPTRAFLDDEFVAAGATLVDDATDCKLVMGVKEVKKHQIKPGATVMCFSHTIKGQSHNMPLLAEFMSKGASLVDYEVIVDDRGVRQVAFGRYAGLAGAHETLWTLAHRMKALGHDNPLTALKHAVDYRDLADMTSYTRAALEALRAEGPAVMAPLVVAVTGNGRVSKGSLEYLDMVGAIPCTLDECLALPHESPDDRTLRVLHLSDEVLYEWAGQHRRFSFDHYVQNPERYVCKGAMYLPFVKALINGLYWDERFPRLLDDSTLRRMFAQETISPVIGDIACDIKGGVEWTVLATQNDEPSFVYDPVTNTHKLGVEGRGVAIMSVDNLPTALPRDASVDFSKALHPYVRTFFNARLGSGVGELPAALQSAVVVAGGRLTPKHQGLSRFL
jgi:saccharopine dehydrogenase (NAD+, L-lysine forming)